MLFFHTNIRWLPKRNATKKVFEFGDRLKLFFVDYGKIELFLVDKFKPLSEFNVYMQRRSTTNIIKYF